MRFKTFHQHSKSSLHVHINTLTMSKRLSMSQHQSQVLQIKSSPLDVSTHYTGWRKKNTFLKWVVVGRVKVDDLPTPPENSAEGSVQ